MPLPDRPVAACAEGPASPSSTYEADFDRISGMTDQPMQYVVVRGTVLSIGESGLAGADA